MNTTAAIVLSLVSAASLLASDLPPLVLPAGMGVNIHFTRGREHDLDLIEAAGFKFIRMDFLWSGTEKHKGEYDWTAYDELTANIERRGIRPIYILDYSNALYERPVVYKNPHNGKEQHVPASPQNFVSIPGFANWAAAASRHFRGHHVVWEIWNEPNIGFWKPKPDANQYAALAMATCRALRSADPQATIIAPGSSLFPWPFLETLFASGILDYLDAVSVHPYRSDKSPETAAEDYQKLRSLIERYAPASKRLLPIISSECGYATNIKGVSLETQAAFITRQQLSNLLNNVPISIWYDWKNDGSDPAYNEDNFGIVFGDLTLKPSYVAAQTLTRQLSGFHIARRLQTAVDDFVLLFVNDSGDQKLAAWTVAKPHTIYIPLGITAAKVSAVSGMNLPLTTKDSTNSTLAIDLQLTPQYFTFKTPVIKLVSLSTSTPQLVQSGRQ